MSTKLALAAAALLAVHARGGEDALAVLRRSLEAAAVPYEGQVHVASGAGAQAREATVSVRYQSPQRYRREISDRRGFPTATIVSDGRSEWVYDRRRRMAWRGEPADADYKLLDPDEELELLSRNYEFRLAGREAVAGLPCDVLELRSRDGRLAQRLWSERARGLILRRESFSHDGRAGSRMRFLRVRLPARHSAEDFEFHPPAGVRVLESGLKPDYMGLEEAAQATGMTPRPPAWLPPGYMFESVNLLPHKGATMLHYRYSDGADVLSLFQCPRGVRLDLGRAASEPARVGGSRGRLWVGPDGKVLEWSAGDRFALVGALRLEELRRVAESVEGSR